MRGLGRACLLPQERHVLYVYALLGSVSLALFGGELLWEGLHSRRPLSRLATGLVAKIASLSLWAVSVWLLLQWIV